MMRLALIPAALMLLYPQPKTAYADVVITDPVVGATTAEIDGVAATVNPDLTIQLSARVLEDGSVNFTVYPQIGVNGHGPDWVAGIIDGGEWCAWTGCFVGRLGWHNIGGPLGIPDWGSLSLGQYVGNRVTVDRNATATVFRILTPAPVLLTPVEFVQAWFANDPAADVNGSGTITVQDIWDFIAEYFAR